MLCKIGCAFRIGTRIKLSRSVNQIVDFERKARNLRTRVHGNITWGIETMGVVTTCHNGGSTAHHAIS